MEKGKNLKTKTDKKAEGSLKRNEVSGNGKPK
jgi:hypothetical protein